MKNYLPFLSILFALSCGKAGGDSVESSNYENQSLISKINTLLRENYYDKDIAVRISDHLSKNEQIGKYEDIVDENKLISIINKDIHQIHNDGHIQLVKQGSSRKINWKQPPILETKILEGNIGYFKIERFPTPSEDFYESIASAFSLLKETSGIIIDLRNNGGGHPEIVSNILGYFDPNGSTYDVFYVPSNDKKYEYKVDKKVKGEKMPGKPVSVLVNGNTGSAAELLAYGFQNLKLGNIIGEKTLGTVSLAEYYFVVDDLYLLLSKGVQQNPFDPKGISGKGVQPDILIDDNSCLKTAHLKMLSQVYDHSLYAWLEPKIEGNYKPFFQPVDSLKKLVGIYDYLEIYFNGEQLIYRASNGRDYELYPIKNNLFTLKSSSEDRFRFEFIKEKGNTTLVKKYFDGEQKLFEKNSN